MDGKEDMQNSRVNAVKDLSKGFLLAIAFILPIFAAVCYSLASGKPSTEAPVSDTVQGVAVAPESVSIMWLGTDDEGKLNSCAMVRLEPTKKRVSVCVIPESAVLLSGKAPLTVADIFAAKGASGVVDAAEETLEVALDHFVCADSGAASLLTEDIGGVNIYLDADIIIDDDSGRTVYKRPKGNVQLTGNDVTVIFESDALNERESSELAERLWLSALSRIAADDVPIAALYASRVDRLDTDINPADASGISRAFTYLGMHDCGIEAVRMDGTYIDGRFEISENACMLLWEYFPREKR